MLFRQVSPGRWLIGARGGTRSESEGRTVRILRWARCAAFPSSGLVPAGPRDRRRHEGCRAYQLNPCQLRVSFRTFFVFRSKRGDRLKVLYWDRDGLVLWYKRLEIGSFSIPALGTNVGEHGLEIRAGDFALLLEGIDLSSAKRSKRYQRPEATPA